LNSDEKGRWLPLHHDRIKKETIEGKIVAALYTENGRVLTKDKIEKWTKFARVLYTAVLGLHFERQTQKKNKQLPIF
jgi:hypothetical protein